MGEGRLVVLSAAQRRFIDTNLSRAFRAPTKLTTCRVRDSENVSFGVRVGLETRTVSMLPGECLALVDDDDTRIGYLLSSVNFPNDAFVFLGLSGSVECRFSITDGIVLSNATSCRVTLLVRERRVISAKANYPSRVDQATLGKLSELLFRELDDALTDRCGITIDDPNLSMNTEDGDETTSVSGTTLTDTTMSTLASVSCATLASDTTSENSKSDRDYIELLLKRRPDIANEHIFFDIRYAIDCANLSMYNLNDDNDDDYCSLTPCVKRGGFYAYCQKRGIWVPCSNTMIEEMLVNQLLELSDITAADQKYLGKNANSITLRRVFAKLVESAGLKTLRRSLNSINVFAMNGSLVENGTTLRPIGVDDSIFANSGWQYNASLAEREREPLQRFIDQIFPMKDEQQTVLSYVADLLSGRREKKVFLVLTDQRQGNNAKSTFLKFLTVFFGETYCAKSIKFLVQGPKTDRNSHDAGLECMNGKRLLIADELTRNDTLDAGRIKDLVSVPDTVTQGRSFGRASTFKFIWQAGIIMAFNEGQFPRFDSTDSAFVSRMLVCNMRSRFLQRNDYIKYIESDMIEPYTYPADPNLVSRFPDWRSSFLDILLETRRSETTRELSVPDSMIEARNDLLIDMSDNDGQLANWVNELLTREIATPKIAEIVQDYADRDSLLVKASDMFNEYSNQRALHPIPRLDAMSRSAFLARIETVCVGRAITVNGEPCVFRRRFQTRLKGENKHRRNVIITRISKNKTR